MSIDGRMEKGNYYYPLLLWALFFFFLRLLNV